MEKTTRTFQSSLTIREGESANIVEGVPIVFNAETVIGGMFREKISPDAISEDVLKDVRLLVNHNPQELPLARSRNNNQNSTMHLWKEDDGVHMRATLDVENPRARELLSAVRRGDIDGMSFAFCVGGERWDDLDADLPLRTITSISYLPEVSAVMEPAYGQTSINARALDSELASLESAKQALDNVRKIEELRKEIQERSEKLCSKND
jgi:HK97 family phage prohead protease